MLIGSGSLDPGCFDCIGDPFGFADPVVVGPVAPAESVFWETLVVFPHRPSQDREGGSSWAFGEIGLGSEFLRGSGDAASASWGASMMLLRGRSLLVSPFRSPSGPEIKGALLSLLGISVLGNQRSQPTDSLGALVPSDG